MRIFVAPLASGELVVRGDEHHYLSRARRARVGDALELVDGEGQHAPATIAAITETETRLLVGPVERIPDQLPRIRVLVPLIKGDRMDTCLEKLVEVGVDEIVVWPAARAVVKLDGERRASRLEHYRGIAQAGARQSGRASIPSVEWADSLASAIAALPGGGHRVVLDPAADRVELPDLVRSPDEAALPASSTHISIASGPEGGLAPAELDTLLAAGFGAVGLGPRVLRAETAPVVAVALVRAASKS